MKIVVIGNGMVGQRFLEQLVTRSAEHDITVFCEEPRPAYDRVQLTSYFSGRTASELNVVPESFFQKSKITLRLNDPVQSIDLERKLVRSARYRDVAYDKLVIATGSFPFVPPVPGRDRRDCFVYRTIEDLDLIAGRAKGAAVGTVIGGGLLGLEAAKALQDLGLETHVVEFAPRLMSVQLDEAAGRLLRRKIEALGASVHLSRNTKQITDGTVRRQKLIFTDGTSLDTDLVVFSAGIRPRDDLARTAGLAVGERGGIRINSRCQTTNPDVYAIGDAHCGKGARSGWSRPGTRWPR
jgi:nitrite reductase (NADH) large subunit